jgi:hypothetical protein
MSRYSKRLAVGEDAHGQEGSESPGELPILEKLESNGRITRGSGRPLEPFTALRIPGRPTSEAISEDRTDRL